MIKEDMVVTMNYTLKDETGTVLDSSQGEPFNFLQGHQNIIPGLEKAIQGLSKGDKKLVTIPPEEGYGEYDPELKFAMPLEQFGGQVPEPGRIIQLTSGDGESFRAQVVGVEQEQIVLDANHPLAGKPLIFDIEITDVRDALPEELTHGHPHGEGGHHH